MSSSKSKCFKINGKLLIIVFYIISSINSGYSQKKDSNSLFRNTIYIDLSTKGAIYSLNYDRIFYQENKIGYSYRIGVSILEDAVALPIGINLFTGIKSSHIEFSLTIMSYIDKYNSFLSKNDLSDKYLYIVPGIGYRYQKQKCGFFFKTVLSPMIILDPRSSNFWKMDPQLYASGSFGLGWSF